MSFEYDFNRTERDATYFAYHFPHTFTRITRFLKTLKQQTSPAHLRDCTPLCQSLSGIDIPHLIVTSRANEDNYNEMDESELPEDEILPANKLKKVVFLTGRVHPGESNSSMMMEGFIRYITGSSYSARELRKRLVFSIVPCTNPDGVLVGNYRVSMSGNDLNRKYYQPHIKLHPVVCAVKKLVKDVLGQNQRIFAFIDMHGHSRKKNIFMYGPQYPIHDARYLKLRVLPKLMSEQSEMFRYFGCKFSVQRSKERTARVVLHRQFNIMNCFTLESSFHGYFAADRDTKDFTPAAYAATGKMLANSFWEYMKMK